MGKWRVGQTGYPIGRAKLQGGGDECKIERKNREFGEEDKRRRRGFYVESIEWGLHDSVLAPILQAKLTRKANLQVCRLQLECEDL